MKHTKKFAGFLLALVMVLALSVTAFAADDGSITIENAVVGQTYNIYKMLNVTISSAGDYSYTIETEWEDFFNEAKEGNGTAYVTVEGSSVSWNDNGPNNTAAFATLAKAYAENKGIEAVDSKKATDTTVKFENLGLGYYLVDSTLGSLCSLDTTTPDVTIKEKNEEPSNKKEVQEDSTSDWGQVNDADIGQTVKFKNTIIAKENHEGYVFHDKMDGLDFDATSIVITNDKEGTEKRIYTADTDYTVEQTGLTDGCTFHVVFTEDFCSKLNNGDVIIISYSATVNENAVIAGDGNKNESKLSYGNENKSETKPSVTRTYVWSFDVLKYGHGDEKNVLQGAEFILLKYGNTDQADNEKKIAIFSQNGNNYKLERWEDYVEEKEFDNSTLVSDKDGKINILGLDASTYYLKETKAPDGYNPLNEDVRVSVYSPGYEYIEGNQQIMKPVSLTAKVNNESGSKLPSTGGMGTTIFYVLGTILLVGSAVLLITRRRMKAEK